VSLTSTSTTIRRQTLHLSSIRPGRSPNSEILAGSLWPQCEARAFTGALTRPGWTACSLAARADRNSA